MNRTEIAKRIPLLAEGLLHEKGYLAPVDLLLRLAWLQDADYQAWRTGKVPYLERVVSGTLSRLSFTMSELRRFARDRGLRPSWTAYMRWGKGARTPLRFSGSGDSQIEQAYATHWLPPGVASGAPAVDTPAPMDVLSTADQVIKDRKGLLDRLANRTPGC